MTDDAAETENSGAAEIAGRKPRSIWQAILLLPSWVAAITLFAMMAVTFADVLLRSALNNPIEYASELTRIFMAILVFASMPMVSWTGTHIIVDLMDPVFNRTMARVRDIVVDLACGVLLLWPAWRIVELAERSAMFGDRTEYMQFPTHYIEYFIAAFTFLTAITFIVRGIARIVAPTKVPA